MQTEAAKINLYKFEFSSRNCKERPGSESAAEPGILVGRRCSPSFARAQAARELPPTLHYAGSLRCPVRGA